MSLDWWSAIVAPASSLQAGYVEGAENYVALPRRSAPSMLIDAELDRAVRDAVTRTSATTGKAQMLARRMGGWALGLPAIRGRLPIGVHVVPSADSGASLREALSEHLAQPIRLAMTAGPIRPNRKPVARLLDESAEICGFTKVAWDNATDALVSTEAASLAALAADPIAGITVPTVLAEADWAGFTLLTTAPLPIDATAATSPEPDAELPALVALAGHRSRMTASLIDTPYWAELRGRLRDEVPLLDVVERLDGGRSVDVGLFHGDWSPWNMARSTEDARSLLVWDWERSRTGVPIGVDAAHHAFQVERFLHATPLADSVTPVIATLSSQLPALDVDPSLALTLVRIELLETLARMHESGLRTQLHQRVSAVRSTLQAMTTGGTSWAD